MSQNTVEVGRAKLLHPEIAFDTEIDNGAALYSALTSLWTSVSNHLPSRWTGTITLNNLSSVTVNHNFNLGKDKLKFLFFESSVQLIDSQISARYLITQTNLNAIQIQNISGIQKAFDVMVLAFRYQITADDSDPSFGASWDTISGTVWNKSLYKNGSHTVSSPQEFDNVIINGNLILNADLMVRGRLIVFGNVVGSGYKFDCDGDVKIFGDVSLTSLGSKDITIRGNLFNLMSSGIDSMFFCGAQNLICYGDVNLIKQNWEMGFLVTAGNLYIYGNVNSRIQCGVTFIYGGVRKQRFINRSGAFDASDCDINSVNTQGATSTATLPLNPFIGTKITFLDSRNCFDAYPLKLLRNTRQINGLASDFICNIKSKVWTATYVDNSYGWIINY